MVKEFTNAMKLYVITHVGLGFIYYFYYSFLLVQEKTPMEISKNMFIAFTIVNVLLYFVSNQLNQEKSRTKQTNNEYFLYALIISEAILAFVAFGVIGK